MAYNDTPLPTDLISDSQPDIRENFQLLQDSQVVDEGSTSDGDYIRYENGWQICLLEEVDIKVDDARTEDVLYRTDTNSVEEWTFPQEFSSDPAGAGSVKSTLGWVQTAVRSNTMAELIGWSDRLIDEGEGFETMSVNALAIGRWK